MQAGNEIIIRQPVYAMGISAITLLVLILLLVTLIRTGRHPHHATLRFRQFTLNLSHATIFTRR